MGHVKQLVAEQGGPNWLTEIFWGDEEQVPEKYWSALSQPDILGNSKALIMRNADSLPESFWKSLTRHLSAFKKNIWPVFCLEKEWKANKPSVAAAIKKRKYWEVAQNKKWIWDHPGLNARNTAGYLKKWADDHELQIDPQALKILLEHAPGDKYTLDNELAKLTLYLGEQKKITPADLAPLNSHAEMDIFACLKALQQGQNATVWAKIFAENEKNSGFVFQMLGLMARETRILWQLVTGQEKQIKMPAFILNQKKQLARQINTGMLTLMWNRILETELKIKSGRLPPEQALEYLISGMEKIFSGSRK
ncbi:MAG: DNA polymerase III subunit delta [Thermodesulfobacteriota bacterium]